MDLTWLNLSMKRDKGAISMRKGILQHISRGLALLACLVITLTAASFGGPIHEAAKRSDQDAVKALIEQDPALINARDETGRTPLHWAARGVHFQVVKLLLEKGGDVNARDQNLTTAIHDLATRNHVEGIQLLLARGAEMDTKNYSGNTALHYACANDAAEAAALLVEKGADLEVRDNYGRTPLLLCARERGGPQTTEILLKARAQVNAKDKFGDTPLDLAAWRGKEAVVNLLLAAGAEISSQGPKAQRLFSEAAANGLSRLFSALTKAGANPDVRLFSNGTLLHAASAGGSVGIVEILLGRGLDINQKDDFGWTPLHYAARDGRLAVAELLASKGAKLNARTLMGQSPVNVAREMKQEKVHDFLIARGADDKPIEFPALEGDYLGQRLPGDEPELFATGIVSSIWGLHSAVAFAPDGNTAMWAPMVTIPGKLYSEGGVMMTERKHGRWSTPGWAPFTGDMDGDVPFFSPDGKRVYFISAKSLPGNPESRRERIWYAEKTGDGWGAPQVVDDIVNDYPHHWQVSVDAGHTIYFSSSIPEGLGGGDIYRSRRVDGRWQKPENLGPAVNTSKGEGMPYISPDGSYLLFARDYDLFISFCDRDGAWKEARKLAAPINSPSIEICPIVSPDGKFLFFISQRGGESHVWWVKAGFIERMRYQ